MANAIETKKLTKVFGKSADADIVLYIGLCNGAGWVTKIQERTTVLLGIEKIIELDWCGKDDMIGLMIHELGHVYQSQYGSLSYQENSMAEKLLWQLFTEGVVQNTDGSIAYNLMQNDMVALRAVMRLGWEIPNPINSVQKDKTKRCPFSVLKSGEE